MTRDRGEQISITPITVPESLEWEYLRDNHLKSVREEYYGNIEFAFRIAEGAHLNQPRRQTGEPFFVHPIMTAVYLTEAGCYHPSHLMAALLHDVPEDNLQFLINAQNRIFERDTGVRLYSSKKTAGEAIVAFELLEVHFGHDTAEIVESLTKPNSTARTEKGKIREERRSQNKLRNGPPGSWVVKAADRLHNLRTLPPDDPLRIQRKIVETRGGYLPIFKLAVGILPEGQILYSEVSRQLRTLEIQIGLH